MKLTMGILEYNIKCPRCDSEDLFIMKSRGFEFVCKNCWSAYRYGDLEKIALKTGNVYNPLVAEFTKRDEPEIR